MEDSPPSNFVDPDTEIFVRKHCGLRRRESFRKYADVPKMVNDWFFNDRNLQDTLAEFVERECGPLIAKLVEQHNAATAHGDVATIEGSTPITEAEHQWKQLHSEFIALFESALTTFLEQQSVTMEEFQTMSRISRDEERRSGLHFYRWMEIVEFSAFVELLRVDPASSREGATASPHHLKMGKAAIDRLYAHIAELSRHARQSHRNDATFIPLVLRWSPPNFDTIERAVKMYKTNCGDQRRLSELPRAEQKELMRWRLKLTTKQINDRGVYDEPPKDEVAWAGWLSLFARHMDDTELDRFVRFLQTAADRTLLEQTAKLAQEAREQALAQSGSSSNYVSAGARVPVNLSKSQEFLSAAAERRVLLQCFCAMDITHLGKVELSTVLHILSKSRLCTLRALKKIELRFAVLRSQKAKECSLNDATRSGSTDDLIMLSVPEFCSLLEELLKPKGTNTQEFTQAILQLQGIAQDVL